MPEQTPVPVSIPATLSFAAALVPPPPRNQSQSGLQEGQLLAENQLQVLRSLCVPRTCGVLCIRCLIACWPCAARWELLSNSAEKCEAQRGWYTCLKSHSPVRQEPGI